MGHSKNIFMEEREICPECNGRKELVYSCCTGDPVFNDEMMCPDCHEHLGEEPCFTCEGKGYVESEEEMKIEILTGKKDTNE
jgi:DnaJ-class molecular chaperone